MRAGLKQVQSTYITWSLVQPSDHVNYFIATECELTFCMQWMREDLQRGKMEKRKRLPSMEGV
jgi:hypothetical protein